jgi:hypothetical protein
MSIVFRGPFFDEGGACLADVRGRRESTGREPQFFIKILPRTLLHIRFIQYFHCDFHIHLSVIHSIIQYILRRCTLNEIKKTPLSHQPCPPLSQTLVPPPPPLVLPLSTPLKPKNISALSLTSTIPSVPFPPTLGKLPLHPFPSPFLPIPFRPPPLLLQLD